MRPVDIVPAACDFWRGQRYKLREFALQDGKTHPFAIICPGGGYNMVCGYLEGVPYAKALNQQGYSAFVLYYRCMWRARFPAPMDDLARAVREVMDRAEDLGLDTENYSVWGSSAGGHLAASFGTEAMGYAHYCLPKPSALVLCYPVITMGAHGHAGSRRNLLGRDPAPEMVELTSVEKQVTPSFPPTFVWWGDVDRTVDPENSRALCRELKKNAVPYEGVEYPGIDHGVGLGEGLACTDWFQRAVDFWKASNL